ncbi:MAG: AraC family transcriptional regulator [Verrucomicrobia bacterium]|nr:AraC family transcriptional regulator [Verrucomicrobiota bacterium]MDA1069706.1 AraC family transcriptional regulator [Verrucomicrobiota bacterium]
MPQIELANSRKDRDAQREIISQEAQLFSFKTDTDIWTTWHYHPEIDILLTLKNTGYHITGDFMGDIKPGTLILNGSNVPHAFHPNEPPEGDPDKPAMLVIQFSVASLGKDLLSKLEMDRIRNFLESTGRSFEFFGPTRDRAEEMMLAMRTQSPGQRFAQFILILDTLASAPEEDRAPLVSHIYAPSLNEQNVERIDRVKNWILENLDQEIKLEDVTRVALMSPKSFSRFFKKNTGKAFIHYVNELRVGLACRKLMQSDASVSEICYASGFNNLSNFNRQFKERKGVSPKAFRKEYRSKVVS